MEYIKSNIMTSDEKGHISYFADLFDTYLSDTDIISLAFADYHAILTETFRLWTLRYVNGDMFFLSQDFRKRFDETVPLIQNVERARSRVDNVFRIEGESGDARFSESDLSDITEFMKTSGSTFGDILDMLADLDPFIKRARDSSDCSVSLVAYRIPYFDRKLTMSLNKAAEHLSALNDFVSVLRDDIRKEDKRMSGYMVDDASIEKKKAQIEQRVRNIGKKEVVEESSSSDIITISFPMDLFDPSMGSQNKFYAIPYGEDDFVFVPKKRVKPLRNGTGEYAIACKKDDLDVIGFRTLSGRMVTFDELRMIILRMLDDRRFI